MREHEVPTHVQARTRSCWGSPSHRSAVTAVCAISYGAYRYAPVGPSEVRMALAVVLGLVGWRWWWGRSAAGGCPWWPPTC